VFQVELDIATLRATVSPEAHRTVQFPQARSYDLDIANFLQPDSFAVREFALDPAGNVALTFAHRHPFAAPDFAAGITGQNRADLGYTGRLLILADLAPGDIAANSWYGGTIRANPRLVEDADGYVNPGDLLANTGPFNANTFPYVLLADEALNNRSNVDNGGQPNGNYDPPSGG
jgi:hypothetical protein